MQALCDEFGLLLIAYNEIAKDSRWGGREMGFKDFLQFTGKTGAGFAIKFFSMGADLIGLFLGLR